MDWVDSLTDADGHDGIHHILLLFLVGFQFGELLCVVQDGHAGRQAGDCVDDNNNGADDKDHIGFGKESWFQAHGQSKHRLKIQQTIFNTPAQISSFRSKYINSATSMGIIKRL